MSEAGAGLRDLRKALELVWTQVAPNPPASWTEGTPDATPSEGPDPYGNPDPEWLRIDWRETLRTVEIPNVPLASSSPPPGRSGSSVSRVNYCERGPLEGDGEHLDIVFVHGLSGSWQNWLENIPHFSRCHRVLALDLPGFGASPMPGGEDLTIAYYGRLLVGFCDALDVRDCAVVGNSMGGFVAAEAAGAQPDRFEKLALVSAAGISHARMRREPAETAARMAIAAAPLALKVQDHALRRPKLRAAAFKAIFHHPEQLRAELLFESFQAGADAPGFLEAIGGLTGYDFLDQLEKVVVPTMIVWGRNDRVVPPADAVGWGQHLRNSQTVIFDETGHCPQLERPVRFNRVLEGFLSR